MRDIVESLEHAKAGLEMAAVAWRARGGKWVVEGNALDAIGQTIAHGMTEITRLRAEAEKCKAVIAAADRGTPIYTAVERVLDEKSAWIARPNDDCTYAIALAAGIAWSIHHPLQLVDQNSELQLETHRLRADVARYRAALIYLCEKANHVSQLGAVTGPQWVGLTSAIVKARAALTAQEKTDGK